ncbi:DUF3667 domain-containing protein [Flavobacterium sp.]|uniref:DUF3667 domain-containing protein n=1 Tax=Flavobacterium sp. TaxID=239 RepID=UPI0008AFD1EE|nr:DUF3667 domain-containing protein [Flavobacterium sp.]OGS62070.1 MAG: hypothetical protein A2X07_09505 [Flavobacteria bacterium GWF1_32_7]HBD25298.1 hypothetical protein [Flavobacterium sp.]
MNCKTCNNPYENTAQYCSNCGAKIVDDRLSLKGTWEEFIGPFFSWDNNFWRTFIGLFTNPKDVLEAYISGARKKYFQPFSYIILYATIAVFFYKFFPMEIIMDYSEGFTKGYNSTNSSSNVPKIDMDGFMKGYMESLMSYYNFFVLLLIPIYALTSYIIFNKRGHNFFEHLVFNSYLQSNLGFISLVLQVVLVNMLGMSFGTYSILFLFLFILFTLYAFKELYNQNLKQSIVSAIKYLLLFFGLYFGIIIALTILFFIIYAIT